MSGFAKNRSTATHQAVPPIQASGLNPGLQFKDPDSAPRSKGKPWYYASPVMILLAVFGFNAMRGKASMDRMERSSQRVVVGNLTRGDLKKAREEIHEIFRNAKPGDISTIDTTVETTTQLSRGVKEYLAAFLAAEKKLGRSMNLVDKKSIVVAENVVKKQRVRTRKDLKVMNRAITGYIDTQNRLAGEFYKKWKVELDLKNLPPSSREELAKKTRSQYLITTQLFVEVLNYMDSHPAHFKDGVPVFAEKDIPELDRLLAKHQKSTKRFVELSQKFDKVLQSDIVAFLQTSLREQ